MNKIKIPDTHTKLFFPLGENEVTKNTETTFPALHNL